MLARFNAGMSLRYPALLSLIPPSDFHSPHHPPCSEHQPVLLSELEELCRRHCAAVRDAGQVSAFSFPYARLMVDAGDPIVRSDEELALSVLRYGKILSRKLENRMQVLPTPPTPHLPPLASLHRSAAARPATR